MGNLTSDFIRKPLDSSPFVSYNAPPKEQDMSHGRSYIGKALLALRLLPGLLILICVSLFAGSGSRFATATSATTPTLLSIAPDNTPSSTARPTGGAYVFFAQAGSNCAV